MNSHYSDNCGSLILQIVKEQYTERMIKTNKTYFIAMKTTKSLFLKINLIVILISMITSCAPKRISLDIMPGELAEKMINNPEFVENPNGENFCWHAAVGLDQFVENYKLTKNTAWLDAGIEYFDFLVGRMFTDPDGYKGWIGPYDYDKRYWVDALVGDGLLLSGMLEFSELVTEDQALKSKYGAKADSYVLLAKKDFVEKWDKRGCFYDDDPYGSYTFPVNFFKPGDLSKWIYAPKTTRAGVSLPFNQQMDLAEVCILLNRITGEKFYWERAEKILFTFKSHFQYFDNHYCWSYFDPLTPGDVDMERNDTRHWVGVHEWRSGYQASEVVKIVKAYHYGIVFDEQDIQRIINTNLNVMWNKDKENPVFINSNGAGSEHDTTGLASFRRAWGHSNAFKNAGELWIPLLSFDQTIRDIYEIRFKNNKDSERYLQYKNTVLASPPSFKRNNTKGEVKIPIVNFTESRELITAAVLPHRIPKDEKSIIICKSNVPGQLQIDLYSLKNKKLCNLYNGNIREGFFTMTWDGKDTVKKTTYKGDYKIRWTIGTGYREFPIVIY